MSRRQAASLEQTWADRLGLDSSADVRAELRERFEHLAGLVLAEEMRPPGWEASAETAVAHGELWILRGFLADARRYLTGEGVDR